jgi:hypothetical protein
LTAGTGAGVGAIGFVGCTTAFSVAHPTTQSKKAMEKVILKI